MKSTKTINCKGKLLDLSVPKVMGILNVTPDSFYDGGRFTSEEKVLVQVEKMLNDGADIIDVGGMSSRPGAEIIKPEQELERVLPVVKLISNTYPESIVSIDTVNAKVAKECIEAGASIINDISAGLIDKSMFKTVAALKVPYILMHMQGLPENMQLNPKYENNIVLEIIDFFSNRIKELEALGITDIIIDPGFGFGKTIEHNYQILKQLNDFSIFDKPILAGLSRKSMIYKPLGISASEALNGTSVLNAFALQNSASILRVHDVKEAKETIKLLSYLNA